ncbi:uncharacterized protein J8A68_004764 [[Candida] subhashii]|uniref:PH domain-containing protein n=1 Tax=[Candida] subhashii TaxID=561895 RepID=A0A8J5QIE6_9ASCO|nr:uncharacterized protein J8A68_004764 [[Candida] subhashii]KAG7661706.1 hypothetical protein J8A68_004764 [[Candida] subhashii]
MVFKIGNQSRLIDRISTPHRHDNSSETNKESESSDKKNWKQLVKVKSPNANKLFSSRESPKPRKESLPIKRQDISPKSQYSTPTSSPGSAYRSPKKIMNPRNTYSRSFDDYTKPGLDFSFEAILADNRPSLTSLLQDESEEIPQASPAKNPVVEVRRGKCFICHELLARILASERVITLACGDSVHSECFKALLASEIHDLHSIPSSPKKRNVIEFSKICKGESCASKKVESKIAIDFDKWNLVCSDLSSPKFSSQKEMNWKRQSSVVSALKSSLLEDKDYHATFSPSKSPPDTGNSSITFNVLKSTLVSPSASFLKKEEKPLPASPEDNDDFEPIHTNNFSKFPIPRNNSRRSLQRGRSSGTMEGRSRSTSPVPSIATSNTVSYKYDPKEAERIKNELMNILLEKCSGIQFSKLPQLGELRIADELSVCSHSNGSFTSRYCYLFENYMLIWDIRDIHDPVFIPIQKAKISSKESVLHISQTNNNNPITISLKSNSSYIIEKWVAAISDFSIAIPDEVITSTINVRRRPSRVSTIPSENESERDYIIQEPKSQDREINARNRCSSYYDSDSDRELINTALATRDVSQDSGDVNGIENRISQGDGSLFNTKPLLEDWSELIVQLDDVLKNETFV